MQGMRKSALIAKAVDEAEKHMALHPNLAGELRAGSIVEAAFRKSVPRIPAGLTAELFRHGWERYRQDQARHILEDICDALHEDYDLQSDPLEQRDWELISELFSEWAGDVELHLLQYIMGLALERGAIGQG